MNHLQNICSSGAHVIGEGDFCGTEKIPRPVDYYRVRSGRRYSSHYTHHYSHKGELYLHGKLRQTCQYCCSSVLTFN